MRTISTANLIAVAIIGAAFAAGFLSGPALAGEPQEVTPFEFTFNYNNNELASTEKAEKLLGRLENRVRDHCGGDRKMSLAERKFVTACVNDTMQQSVSKFGSEAVAQAYRSRADG